MFQQVTEVFGLSGLIGSTPEGTIFQFALCLLLYNMIQVIRGVIATEVEKPREKISTENLFDDVQREMIAWSVVITPEANPRAFLGESTTLRREGSAERVAGKSLARSLAKVAAQEKEASPSRQGETNTWIGLPDS